MDKKTRKKIKKLLGIVRNDEIEFKFDPFTKEWEVYKKRSKYSPLLCVYKTVAQVLADKG